MKKANQQQQSDELKNYLSNSPPAAEGECCVVSVDGQEDDGSKAVQPSARVFNCYKSYKKLTSGG